MRATDDGGTALEAGRYRLEISAVGQGFDGRRIVLETWSTLVVR